MLPTDQRAQLQPPPALPASRTVRARPHHGGGRSLNESTLERVRRRVRCPNASCIQSALQNVELEVFFRTGRDDAEAAAKVEGEVDPLLIKHEAEDEDAAAWGHPAFYTIQEQREMQAAQIQNQAKRVAFVKYGEGEVLQVQSPFFPDPSCDKNRLATVEEHYLSECFRPAPAEDVTVPRSAPIFEATSPIRRVKVA